MRRDGCNMALMFFALFVISASAEDSHYSSGQLGGGYGEAKWGMSPREVTNAIKIEGLEPEEHFLPELVIIYEKNIEEKKWHFEFWNEKLVGMTHWPQPRNKNEAIEVYSALKEKHGEAKHQRQECAGGVITVYGTCDYYEWSDGVTKINYKLFNEYPENSMLIYESTILSQMKQDAEK